MKATILIPAFLGLIFVLSSCARQDVPQTGLEPLASWANLGGKVHSNAIIYSLTFNASGNPIVVIRESRALHANYRVYVKQWVNGTWKVLGSVINNNPDQTASSPDLALDKLGRPVVAWIEANAQGYEHLYVKRWNGQTWVRLGARLNVSHAVANKVGVAIDSQNRPVVAWSEYDPSGSPVDNWNLHVKRWENDSSWVSLGGVLDVDVRSATGNVSLAIDPSDRPVIAWTERDLFFSTSNSYIKRWNGSNWVSLGGPFLGYDQSSLSMVLSQTGKPIIAYTAQTPGGRKAFIMRWDGNGIWTPMASFNTGGANHVLLASRGNTLMIASWIGESLNLLIKRWNGVDRWVNVGSQPVVMEESSILDLEISPAGVLTLAYFDQHFTDVSARGAYVKQYR